MQTAALGDPPASRSPAAAVDGVECLATRGAQRDREQRGEDNDA